ncbi:MAG: cytochrome P450 [Anaerolineae bacterium]|nr:cytochrome P450 [Anaerolineae bacterium]MDW8173471.1 cytochrome P450 [Anaerolineae bacterium]
MPIPQAPAIRSPFKIARTFDRTIVLDNLANSFSAYGDTFSLNALGQTFIFTRDPQWFREVLVTQAAHFGKDQQYTDRKRGLARFVGNGLLTSDGDFWKRQRKLVAPALHAKRIEAYAETMVHFAQAQTQGWRDGARIDIAHEMMNATLMVVGRTLFNFDASADSERVGRAMHDIQTFDNTGLLPTWIPTPMELRARRAIRDLDAMIYGLIAKRRGQPDQGDLLSMLLEARDDDGRPMSDGQVRDEAVTLFLAGHETTANTLNWTWLALAQNPDVEAKLHQELDRVLSGRLPSLADLRYLPYAEMVIKEALRLYPPAWSYSRLALDDVQVNGEAVVRGTVVVMFTYFLHRRPDLFEEPLRFSPERFSPDNEARIEKYHYLPFGSGPRVCIGNSFAMMEAQLMLATLASRWQMRLPPGHAVRPYPAITMNPDGGLPMILKRRTPSAQAEAEPQAQATF